MRKEKANMRETLNRGLISDREDLVGVLSALDESWLTSRDDQTVSTLRFNDAVTLSESKILELEAASFGSIGSESQTRSDVVGRRSSGGD